MPPPSSYRLPPDITSTQETLRNGGRAYVFRHRELGRLGRLLMEDVGGQSMMTAEVDGDPADPMTARRRALLEPITTALMAEVDAQLASGVRAPRTYEQSPAAVRSDGELVQSQLVPCERCGAPALHLVFANEDGAGLEDCARMMHSRIAALNAPTWIIGPPLGLVGDPNERPANVLKVWPNREPVRRVKPEDFHAETQHLVTEHCPRR